MSQSIFLRNNSDKAVLLFHGMTGSPGEMAGLAKALHRAGYTVSCPVLPGHCEGTEAIKKVKWQDWTKFAVEQFEELKKSYKEVYTAGLCLGAILAFKVAKEKENEVAAVGGLSTTLYLDGWNLPWYKGLLPIVTNTILKFFYYFPESEPYGIKNEKMRKRVVKMLEGQEESLDCFPMVCIAEMLKLSKYIRRRENISKITTPFILFHSTEDDLTSTKSSDFIFHNTSSSIKQYEKLENSYHLITIDNEKDIVAQKLIEFFDRNKLTKI